MRAELATPADDAELRRLHRDNPMCGDVTVSLEREPCYFRAASVAATRTTTIVIRDDATGTIAAGGDMSLRPVYLNGDEVEAAYLSALRIDHPYRGRIGILERGFSMAAALHRADPIAALHFTTIVRDNDAARRRLERPIRGTPRYDPIDDLETFFLTTRSGSPRSSPKLGKVRAGRIEDREAIATLLSDCLSRFQFAFAWAHAWDRADLAADLPIPEDFLVLEEGGTVTAAVALWDQRAYRQAVVRGYSARLGALRPFVNMASHVLATPRLPDLNTPMPLVSLAGLAVKDDDPDRLIRLLDGVRAAAHHRSGMEVLALTLSERHPLAAPLVKRYRPRRYLSRLYALDIMPGVCPDAIDRSRPSQPEVALL